MSGRGKGESETPEIKEEELQNLFMRIMEGYNDTAIPPLSYFSTPEIPNRGENSRSCRKREKDELERKQNACERRRRNHMNENFSILQSMVPSLLNTKPSKEKIVDDTLKYVKCLQKEAERLEGLKKLQSKMQKVEMPILSKCMNHKSINVTISDSAAFLAIQLPSRRGSVLDILRVLERHQADVIEARINVNDEKVMTFTATVMLANDGGSSIDMMRQDILTSLGLSYTDLLIMD